MSARDVVFVEKGGGGGGGGLGEIKRERKRERRYIEREGERLRGERR